jgi:hypothetical protein
LEAKRSNLYPLLTSDIAGEYSQLAAEQSREAITSSKSHSGAALSPCELDSFEANEASTITTAMSAITIVQIALISGFTPSRTSE